MLLCLDSRYSIGLRYSHAGHREKLVGLSGCFSIVVGSRAQSPTLLSRRASSSSARYRCHYRPHMRTSYEPPPRKLPYVCSAAAAAWQATRTIFSITIDHHRPATWSRLLTARSCNAILIDRQRTSSISSPPTTDRLTHVVESTGQSRSSFSTFPAVIVSCSTLYQVISNL